MSRLEQTIGGVFFRSPITVGAGPLTGRLDLLQKAAACGAGAVSIKQTPYSQPRPGVRKMYAEKGGYFFNPSDTRLDYHKTADMVKAIKDETDMAVLVNILGDGADVETWIFLADLMREAGAAGVTAFCSPKGVFPIDIYQGGKPKMAAMDACSFGGINGPAIRQTSKRIVADAWQAAPELGIIGGGGISKPEHAIETIMFGADVIFMHTQIMLEGYEIISRFSDFLLEFMEKQGYETVGDMKGLALKHVITASELDPTVGPPAKVDPEKCIGCGTCAKIAFCRAISMKEKKAQVDGALCECCGLCASLCPKSAISF